MKKVKISFLIGLLALSAQAAFNDEDLEALRARVRGLEKKAPKRMGEDFARQEGNEKINATLGINLVMGLNEGDASARFMIAAQAYFEAVGGGMFARANAHERGRADETGHFYERMRREQEERDRAEADRRERERQEGMRREQEERDRAEADRRERERQERMRREREEADRREQERVRREQAERVERERQERVRREQAAREEAARKDREQAEADRKAREQAESDRKKASGANGQEKVPLTVEQRKAALTKVLFAVYRTDGSKANTDQTREILEHKKLLDLTVVDECDKEAKCLARQWKTEQAEKERKDREAAEEAERQRATAGDRARAAAEAARERAQKEQDMLTRARETRARLARTKIAYEQQICDLERQRDAAEQRTKFSPGSAFGGGFFGGMGGVNPDRLEWQRLAGDIARLNTERLKDETESTTITDITEDLQARRAVEGPEDRRIRAANDPQSFEVLFTGANGVIIGQFLIPVERDGKTYNFIALHPDRAKGLKAGRNVYISDKMVAKGVESLLSGLDDTTLRLYNIQGGNTFMGLSIK